MQRIQAVGRLRSSTCRLSSNNRTLKVESIPRLLEFGLADNLFVSVNYIHLSGKHLGPF